MPEPAITTDKRTGRIRRLSRFMLAWLIFALAGFTIQLATNGYATDRGNHGDEAAHFVSSLVIADYLREGAPAGPMAFAKEYYRHFPKVAIGHWPPVFEGLQALAFAIFSGTGTVALALQALIAGFAAALPATLLAASFGIAEGVLGGAIVLLSPIFLPMLDMVMADMLLAVFVTLTALAWSRFYQRRTWRTALLFALAAAAAILTKGTGFGLALLPVIYLALKGNIAFLFNRKTLAAGALVAGLTLPWYALTYKMAADGFVYGWGWSYTRLAVPFFLGGLATSIGIPCLLAVLAGIYFGWRQRQLIVANLDIAAFIATALAMLAFSMLAPADLDRRYLIPLLPSLAIVAVWGLSRGMAAVVPRPAIARAVVVAVLAVSIALVFRLPQPRSFQSARLAEAILASGEPNPLILVTGSVMAEGAFISSFAERDPAAKYYVIRAQKVLAASNWMGTDYRLKFTTAAAMADWISQEKIGWIVLDSDTLEPEFPHAALLQQALDQGLLAAKPVATSPHPGGRMALYALPAAAQPAEPSPGLLRELGPGHLGDAK
jgi:hypothetical protein